MRVNFSTIKNNIYKPGVLKSAFNLSFKAEKTPVIIIDKDGEQTQAPSIVDAAKILGVNKQSIYDYMRGRRKPIKGYTFKYADENQYIPGQRNREKQIYSVDKDGNYRKFSTVKEAGEKLGLVSNHISVNLNGGVKYYKNYVFVHANDLEVKDENGNISIDTDKINEVKKVLNNKKRQRNEKIFYLINTKKQARKYDKYESAAKEAGVSKSGIARSLSGGSKFAGQYAVVLAQDIEIKNPDGTTSLNEEKIAQTVEELNNYLNEKKISKQVYLIDKAGNYKKYFSKKSAAEHLGTNYSNLIHNINGVTKTIKGHICIPAKDIEVRDKNGQFKGVNQQKLQEAVAVLNPVKKAKSVKSAEKSRGIPVYIIKNINEYKRYNSILDASKAINVYYNTLKAHLDFSNCNIKGSYCVYASDIETKRADGKTEIDKSKLYNFIRDNYKNNDIYIVDVNGFYRKFKCIDEIKQKLGVTPITIEKKLNGEYSGKAKYFCIKASDVDVLDDNLNVTLDKRKMAEKINELKGIKPQELSKDKQKSHEIYAIDSEGNYKLYSGITEAANKLWVKPWEISNCLCGVMPDVEGYRFVKASDMDKNTKDAQNLHELFVIYAVTAKGNVFKFKSFKDAEKHTKIPASEIKEIIDNPAIKKRGCIFLSSTDITKIDKDGKFTDNKEKIKELYYKAFPPAKN